MKPMRFGIRALLLLFTLLFALTGCGLLQDIGDTYGEELGALGMLFLIRSSTVRTRRQVPPSLRASLTSMEVIQAVMMWQPI